MLGCGRAQLPPQQRFTVAASCCGSYIPNASQTKQDRGQAKISCVSQAARRQFPSWAKMDSHNRVVMGGKTVAGQIVRNFARRSVRDAQDRWESGQGLLEFYNCVDAGAAVTMLVAQTPQDTAALLQELSSSSSSGSSSSCQSGRALFAAAPPAPQARPAQPVARPATHTPPASTTLPQQVLERPSPRLDLRLYTLGVQFLCEGLPPKRSK